MLYTDFPFWVALVLFLAIYYLLRHHSRWGMVLYVLAFNMLFFWWANGWMMLLLPLVAVVSWWVGHVLRESDDVKDKRLRRFTLGFAIVVILLPLFYYKYSHFFLSSLNDLFSSRLSFRDLVLPIGISFFSFQSISYVVDVYRRRFTERVGFIDYFFYLSFFPLLLAGPITRAGTLLPQLKRLGQVSERWLYVGYWLVMLGLLKKCVIADYIAQYNDWIFDAPMAYSGFECLMGILGYSVQIYCDFSGYSDMSIGIASLMGFYLPDNFSFPYRAQNISDFWRRWHISLSTWFRDYVYIPMGGNRCGRARTYINNTITMLVAGLWHGASWMFVLWGAMHGLALAFHKMLQPVLRKLPSKGVVRVFSCLFTFIFVTVSWVFFRSTSVADACSLLIRSVADFDIAYLWPFLKVRPWWMTLMILPLLAQFVSDRGFRRLQTRFVCLPWLVKLLMFAVAIQIMLQFRTSNVSPFIYSQF